MRLGQAVIDVEPGAEELESVGSEGFTSLQSLFAKAGSRSCIAGRGEVSAVIGQHG